MARATQAALTAVGPPPPFNPFAEFVAHLEVEYGRFRRDQMQRIQDFRREKDDTPRTMYTRLARFAVESGGVFAESQIVKKILSKIDKRLLELASPRIILDYEGRATLAQAFAVVERCDQGLCQHDAADMVSWMSKNTKSRRIVTATSSLAETQPVKEQNNLYCWDCGEAGHSKNDPNCPKKKKTQPLGKLKQNIEPVKVGDNSKKRQFKCNHCGGTNHDVDYCFQLHPEMRPASYLTGKSPREQSLEAKVAELEQKLKSSASFAQIFEPHAGGSTSGADMYMFGASGEVVVAASTRSQTLADAVASTSGSTNEVSHPRHAGPADQVGQARLPLSFGLVDTTVVGAKNHASSRYG